MAGRGRGRGIQEENWAVWGGGGGWDPHQYPPHPAPPPQYFNQPPPPWGFYPPQPQVPPLQAPYQGYRQFDNPRPRGGGNQGRGRGRQQQQARVQANQGQIQAEGRALGEQGGNTTVGTGADQEKQVGGGEGESSGEKSGKNIQAVCFNCGDIGHLSSACKNQRVCFICYQSDHGVDNCPKWKEPPKTGQYYGSANIGLGFFHIDVEARNNRFRHWRGLDNFGSISIVEGEIEEAELVENLKKLFDKSWAWQLKKTEENTYLTRFPPNKKVEDLVIGQASKFNLNKAGVVASLSVWNGNIEPVGQLVEVWVQVTRIPPKWVDWDTVREVASSIGLMIELDWQTLFNSFFSIVRVKILCKDPLRIPRSRIYAFKQDLHVIYFKVEGFEQADSEDGDLEGFETINPEDTIPDEVEENKQNHGKENENASGGDKSAQEQGGHLGASGSRTVNRALTFDEVLDNTLQRELTHQDVSLLQSMELEGEGAVETDDEEEFNTLSQDDKLLEALPKDWVYDLKSGNHSPMARLLDGQMESSGKVAVGDTTQFSSLGTACGQDMPNGVSQDELEQLQLLFGGVPASSSQGVVAESSTQAVESLSQQLNGLLGNEEMDVSASGMDEVSWNGGGSAQTKSTLVNDSVGGSGEKGQKKSDESVEVINISQENFPKLQGKNGVQLNSEVSGLVSQESGVCNGDDGTSIVQQKVGKGKAKKQWGPVIPMRRSSRNIDCGKTVMANAQEVKRKWNLEDNTEYGLEEYGNTLSFAHRDSSELDGALPGGKKALAGGHYEKAAGGSKNGAVATLLYQSRSLKIMRSSAISWEVKNGNETDNAKLTWWEELNEALNDL